MDIPNNLVDKATDEVLNKMQKNVLHFKHSNLLQLQYFGNINLELSSRFPFMLHNAYCIWYMTAEMDTWLLGYLCLLVAQKSAKMDVKILCQSNILANYNALSSIRSAACNSTQLWSSTLLWLYDDWWCLFKNLWPCVLERNPNLAD